MLVLRGSCRETKPAPAVVACFCSCFALWFMMRPLLYRTTTVPLDNWLLNRFLVQRNLLYVPTPHPGSPLTSHSAFPQNKPDVDGRDDKNGGTLHGRVRLNSKPATFRDYYLKKYGLELRYPGARLLRVQCVEKHAHMNPFVGQRAPTTLEDEHFVHLMPELTSTLPIPRDWMYLVNLAERYMPELECKIDTYWNAYALSCYIKQSPIFKHLQTLPISPTLSIDNENFTNLLADLLFQALTVYPVPTFERLEFLGDSVFGYFLALNVMHVMSVREWDSEKVVECIELAAKNVSLTAGCLRVGLPRRIRHMKTKWRVANSPEIDSFLANKKLSDDPDTVLEYGMMHDTRLADIMESFLAAAFLSGRGIANESCAALTIAILNEARPPFTLTKELSKTSGNKGRSSNVQPPWLMAPGPCIKAGYPFQFDPDWLNVLNKIETILQKESHLDSILQKRVQAVMGILEGLTLRNRAMAGALLDSCVQRLLLCAMWDDTSSLDDTDGSSRQRQNAIPQQSPSLESLDYVTVRLADMKRVFVTVGAYALQLLLSEQVVQRFPDADPNDLHLLRCTTISDDVIAYVTVRYKLQQDMDDRSRIHSFEKEMIEADIRGRQMWDERDGWIVPNGIAEFQKRCQTYGLVEGHNIPSGSPHYCGVGGGRLIGYSTKLPEPLTWRLKDSFKSLFGALVLGIGLDATWTMIGPLFQELLLLSPDETRREFTHVSTLVKSYHKGTPFLSR